ncbi:CRTAC1 family protein [Zavarzinella formosa]|uniref:CRTAC1 family protein n=1 Tax=Zavarzinella formosa TaxID=360055 RepID=UPI0002FF5196|nr:CRTAC1 family protein [Zavarzinella formosa]
MSSSRRLLIAIGAVVALFIAGGVWFATRAKPAVEVSPEAAPKTEEPAGPVIFEDVTPGSGVVFTCRNGEEANRYTILESLGCGVAVLDYDGDGRLDLFFPGGGYFEGDSAPQIRGLPGKLYRNLGNWKFADVTAQAGLDGPVFYSHGATAGDYDRDGFPDLLVTGWNRTVLYHNVSDGNGGRRFEDVSEKAGLTDTRWATSAAWGDLDGDGFPDLYVCYYTDWSFANDPKCTGQGRDTTKDVCSPHQFGPLQHRLYRNKGDGTFADITATAPLRPDGKGLGVLITDLDADGRPDIYVANDGGDNFLYVNRGGMKFEERGRATGCALDDTGLFNGSMGVDAADYDESGRPSVWVTNYQGELHALYRNLGPTGFRHDSQSAGVARLGRQFVGFGTGFVDFDNDGWEDLVISNGHVLRHPTGSTVKQRPVLLRNEQHDGRRQFREIPGKGGPYFRGQYGGRGLAVADLDDDGWPDLIITHQNEPVVLLRNVAGATGTTNNWLGISLAGRDRRDVAGATVTLEVNGRKLTRFTHGGGSYLSTGDSRLRFGLGAASQVGRLTVRWPNGKEEQYDGLQPGRYWRITEGNPKPETITPPK